MSYMLANADGTLASGTYATAPTPAKGQRVALIPGNYPAGCYWSAANGGGFVDYMTEAQCLAYVDAAAGVRRQTAVTVAGGQADMYRRKQAEVDKANTLGGTTALILSALNTVTPAQRAALYPLLTLEMTVMGYTTLGQAYTLVSNGIATANAKLNAIELARRQAKMAIRAATTIAAKNAAATTVTWPS